MVLYYSTVLRWWRNWQTRRIKDPVGNFLGAGSSPAHRTNINSAKAEFFIVFFGKQIKSTNTGTFKIPHNVQKVLLNLLFHLTKFGQHLYP